MKYFKNIETNEVFAYDETYANDLPYINQAIKNGWVDISDSWPPNPTITKEQLLAGCKAKAKQLLEETDWVEVPSVSDASNEVHLANLLEFLSYRTQLRKLAVSPEENPTWPEKPDSIWKNT